MENFQNFSSICVKCGICCDGTLFSKARIKDEADEQLVKGLGLSIFEQANGKRYFHQPCSVFDGCCTVYQLRPKVCQYFLCEPLKKVKNNEMSFEQAEKLVTTTLALRSEIVETASKIEIFKHYSIPLFLKEMVPKPSEKLKEYPALLIKIAAIRVALMGFRKK